MGSSGVKLLGSNLGSPLRRKSTRDERRCEVASEGLVIRVGFVLCKTDFVQPMSFNAFCTYINVTKHHKTLQIFLYFFHHN